MRIITLDSCNPPQVSRVAGHPACLLAKSGGGLRGRHTPCHSAAPHQHCNFALRKQLFLHLELIEVHIHHQLRRQHLVDAIDYFLTQSLFALEGIHLLK